MFPKSNLPLLFYLVSIISCTSRSEVPSRLLWYDEPADEWTEALPLGNGRIGAMVFGDPEVEHIQFNEETLWTGEPRDYSREGAVEHLEEIRQLLFDGKQKEAEELAGREFMGKRSNEGEYPEQKAQWVRQVRDPRHLELASPDYEDSFWKEFEVPARNGWEEKGVNVDGAVWFRLTFDLPESWQGKDLTLDLGRVRDEDFTYFNGQFIGTSEGRNNERNYIVPSRLIRNGKNVLAVQVLNYDNKGGLTGLRDGSKPMMIYPSGQDRQQGIDLQTIWKYHVQNDNPPAFPQYEASYQPFGDLWFTFPEHDSVHNYRRELDITRAVSRVSYLKDGVTYQREYFASAPAQALMVRFTASEQGKLTLEAKADSPHQGYRTFQVDDQTLGMQVNVRNGALHGVVYLKALPVSGEMEIVDGTFRIKEADEVVFILTAATNFKRYDDVSGDAASLALTDLNAIPSNYQSLLDQHVDDYRQLYDRFSVDFGSGDNTNIPTDERISAFRTSGDPDLAALYVQYGRYLLISTSRPGTRPPNLQGIWNDQLMPPWGSKYTTNINLEMNYWPTEVLNLSELHQPLFELISEVAERGRETASEHYGADGWVLHHNTDLWRGTAPINASNHGIWVTGGAWLTTHLWEHFLFTYDTAFLRNTAYPLMKGSAEFFVDFLIEDPETSFLISTPSNSPENGGLVAAPAMDHQLIRSLFSNCIKATEILDVDTGFQATLRELLPRIAPNRIGRHGQLQEWLEDIDDPQNKHRHVSHLWAVYPGNEISVETPELLDAAKQSLIFRGDEGTGWSLAWKINLWARFRDGNHAWELVETLLSPAWVDRQGRGGSYANLFDAHPPFQIDGNFGAAAGIMELLVQSQGGKIVLLPALPDALPDGEVKGIKVRGDFEIDLSWKNSNLQHVRIVSGSGNTCRLEYLGKEKELATDKDAVYLLNAGLEVL